MLGQAAIRKREDTWIKKKERWIEREKKDATQRGIGGEELS